MPWSGHQEGVFSFVESGEGSAIVEAVAGSGKTTTIVEAAKRIKPERSVLFLAFNKNIADELRSRLPTSVQAKTLNALGYRIWTRRAGKFLRVDANKTREICKNLLGEEERLLEPEIKKLVALAKSIGLVPRDVRAPAALVQDDDQVWLDLIAKHDIDLDAKQVDKAIAGARFVLSVGLRQEQVIDYDDQLYLPVVMGEPPPERYDWVIVDEAQDVSPIQRALIRKVLKPGGRLLAVGDPHQAIYGFRGADSESLGRIAAEFGCVRLPLSISYRCAQNVVFYAQTVVGHIEAAPDAPEGLVECWPRWQGSDMVAGDMVVCRNVAPLISLAYALLARRVPAQVMGRDIGEGLIALIKRLKPRGLDDLVAKLEKYLAAEVEKAVTKGQEEKAEAAEDRVGSILAFISGGSSTTVPELFRSIEELFGNKDGPRVVLSTVHKAKGLESERVFVLDPWRMPSRWARQPWQKEQEKNLMYVAYTRAKRHLVFVNIEDLAPIGQVQQEKAA